MNIVGKTVAEQQAEQQVVGRLITDRSNTFYIEPLIMSGQELPARIQLEPTDAELASGLYVLVSLKSVYGVSYAYYQQTLGEANTPGIETRIAVAQYGLQPQWPPGVLAQATALPTSVTQIKGRTDLRKLPLLTIDDDSACDHDDAVYCRQATDGSWRLWVAIADVAHYVEPDTLLDQVALERGCSVYFPIDVVPMLPEQLSNDICSLKPNEDRLCMVCEMALTRAGECTDYQFYEAIMHSHARLSYAGVTAVLQPELADLADPVIIAGAEVHEQMRSQLEALQALYQVLRVARERRGALDIEMPTARFIFSSQQLVDIQADRRTDSHKVVEECMIAANVCAAEFCTKNKLPCLYRVHEPPEDSSHIELAQFLRSLGVAALPIKEKPTSLDYQSAIAQLNSRPDGALLSLQVLKAMNKATYQANNIGHFGLALERYAHFTSPIRRYADLLVHRAIKGVVTTNKKAQEEAASKVANNAQLQQIAVAVSDSGNRAGMATRFADNWLKCSFMKPCIGQIFTAEVVGVREFGLFIKVSSPYIQGMIHISALGEEYFRYRKSRQQLVGSRTRKIYRLRDIIRVKLEQVEQEKGRLTFVPAELLTHAGKGRRKSRPKKRSRLSKKQRLDRR